jgi:Toprim-like/Protein of unknown function (DUF3991)
MDQTHSELTDFKTRINLTEYAAAEGYELDRKASSRGSAVMRHASGDKIIVGRGQDGHWVYFSVFDSTDSGTVIDFVQRRKGGTLGNVRQVLRPWIGVGISPPASPPLLRPSADRFVERLEPITRDVAQVRARFEAMNPIGTYNAYLCEARAIPPALLAQPAFASRIRVDERGNVIFPHFNTVGLCGYEIKNRGFTGFASGGTKGLWASVPTPEDERLVVAETAIDALSYAVLAGHHRARFVSIAGQMNPEQPALLRSAIGKLAAGGRIVLAFDNDEGGDSLAARVTELFAEAQRADLTLIDDRPSIRGADWNDVLVSKHPPGHGPEPR